MNVKAIEKLKAKVLNFVKEIVRKKLKGGNRKHYLVPKERF